MKNEMTSADAFSMRTNVQCSTDILLMEQRASERAEHKEKVDPKKEQKMASICNSYFTDGK
jgi:hypothetical protein